MSQSVAFVLTSCGRWDLLEKTLDSFLECNTYPIKDYIIVEDSGNKDIVERIKSKYPFVQILENEIPIGQLKSIDKAYSAVTTPYIFHCEDDWFFHTEGDFIKESIDILESSPACLQVWLRDNEDNPHKSYDVVPEWEGWNGFSFNPGLRRLSDYGLIRPYSQYKDERAIDQKYKSLGYYSKILPKTYCYHIGYNRSHYMKKKCIINQPRGIGDILFLEPLCRWLNEGYEITFPVEDSFYWIKDYIPYVKWVKKSEFHMDYEKFSWGKICEHEYFPLRFANPIHRGLMPHDYSDQFNCMKDKYRLFGKDPEMWKDLKWWRDFEKEDLLFKKLGLEEDENYIFVNEESSLGKTDIKVKSNLKKIYQAKIEGFTLLDWAKVIQMAKEIHTVNTSNFYLIETLPLRATELHMYGRVKEGIAGIKDLMTKKWVLHED
jgi:hypothetical protein